MAVSRLDSQTMGYPLSLAAYSLHYNFSITDQKSTKSEYKMCFITGRKFTNLLKPMLVHSGSRPMYHGSAKRRVMALPALANVC